MESLNQNQNKKNLLQLMQNFQKSTKNSSVQDLANTFTGGDSTEVFRALYCASTLCEVCDFRESKQCTIDLYDSLNDQSIKSKMPTYDHSLHKKRQVALESGVSVPEEQLAVVEAVDECA